jgi:hypothetical protein
MPRINTFHIFIPKGRKDINTVANTVHIRIEIIRKLRRLLNHIELNISHTSIVTGTAITNVNHLIGTVAISRAKNTIAATSHTKTILIPVIKP